MYQAIFFFCFFSKEKKEKVKREVLPYQALAPPGLRRGHDSPPRPPRPCTAVLDIVRGFQNLTVILNLFQMSFVKYSLKIENRLNRCTATFSKSTSLVLALSIAV